MLPGEGSSALFDCELHLAAGTVIVSKFQGNYDQTSRRIMGLHPGGRSEVRARQNDAVTWEGKKVCSKLQHSAFLAGC